MQRHITCILLAAMFLPGCRAKPQPVTIEERVEAVTPENADALRDMYRSRYPGSQLGVVAAVVNHANGAFAAVGGIDLKEIGLGRAVTFIDSRQRPLAHGTVVNILPDSIHVRIDQPVERRLPQMGDMMFYYHP